ncbi:MAG: PLD nuclease N-terminal domain-containing protein, partial [Verrucomicrobiota bacterium]|nr:PLD nuclease N-terminal domain-containing protein [Verrucomicrobiota bacterium]
MDSVGRLIELTGPYLGSTLGFGLAFLIIARLMKEKRRPSATVAWLLLMLWVPVLGVPLYLIFGGRKISRLTQRKDRLDIAEPETEGAIRSSPFGVLTRSNRTRVQATGEQAY